MKNSFLKVLGPQASSAEVMTFRVRNNFAIWGLWISKEFYADFKNTNYR
jgi:hypothetical protein